MVSVSSHDAALHIGVMTADLAIRFSPYTDCWYASAPIEVSDGAILRGNSEHRPQANDAVVALFEYYKTVKEPERLVAYASTDKRTAWRWNGVCFARVKESP